MTDQTPNPDTEPHGATGESGGENTPTVPELLEQIEDLKRNSRRWEERAKSNKSAADRLAEIERERVTDEDKRAAERADLEAATKRADDAEAALMRLRIAVDLGLSADDAAVLANIKGDEETLRGLAERLANGRSGPKPNPAQGNRKGETAPASNAERFAEVLSGLM